MIQSGEFLGTRLGLLLKTKNRITINEKRNSANG